MTHKAWHTGVQPKWRWTCNIHEALEGKDGQLDFFIMTSSVSGSARTVTECITVLQTFARYRQSLGNLVSSVALDMISEVGHLHGNPEIEALLLRKGIQPLNREEFFQIFNVSLPGTPSAGCMNCDKLAKSHVSAGFETHNIRNTVAKEFDVKNGTTQDPRIILLSASLDASSKEDGAALTSIDAS